MFASYILPEASLFSFCIPCAGGIVGRREDAWSKVEVKTAGLQQVSSRGIGDYSCGGVRAR